MSAYSNRATSQLYRLYVRLTNAAELAGAEREHAMLDASEL